jgi:hypothetical protein
VWITFRYVFSAWIVDRIQSKMTPQLELVFEMVTTNGRERETMAATIGFLPFGAAIFRIGLLAGKALHDKRSRAPQSERKGTTGSSNSRIPG